MAEHGADLDLPDGEDDGTDPLDDGLTPGHVERIVGVLDRGTSRAAIGHAAAVIAAVAFAAAGFVLFGAGVGLYHLAAAAVIAARVYAWAPAGVEHDDDQGIPDSNRGGIPDSQLSTNVVRPMPDRFLDQLRHPTRSGRGDR